MFFTGMTIFAKSIKSLWRWHTSHGILKQNRQKTQNTEKQKACFLKEYVQNADLQKSALNKIMITHEYTIKYDFVAPLKSDFHPLKNLGLFVSLKVL